MVVEQTTTRSRRSKAETKLASPIRNPENILKKARQGPRPEIRRTAKVAAIQESGNMVLEERRSETPGGAGTEHVNPWLAAFRQRRQVGAL